MTEKVATKKTANQSNRIKNIFLIMIAIASGFFGGWFGGQQKSINGSENKVTREIVESEGNLINAIAKDVNESVVSIDVRATATARNFFGYNQSYETGGAGLASSGQIAGFTNVAFPIVRKVFAGLIANEVVSVQPMNLPSGLLFFLDYTYGSNVGGDAGLSLSNSSANETYTRGQSIYNLPTGAAIRSGSTATGGQYGLIGTGYSRVQKQALNVSCGTDSVGYWLSGSTWTTTGTPTVKTTADFVGFNARFVGYDPQVEVDVANNLLDYTFLHISASELASKIAGIDLGSLDQIAITGKTITSCPSCKGGTQ
jgi:hypothetical protein